MHDPLRQRKCSKGLRNPEPAMAPGGCREGRFCFLQASHERGCSISVVPGRGSPWDEWLRPAPRGDRRFAPCCTRRGHPIFSLRSFAGAQCPVCKIQRQLCRQQGAWRVHCTGKTALIWQARVRKAKELEVHVYVGPAL